MTAPPYPSTPGQIMPGAQTLHRTKPDLSGLTLNGVMLFLIGVLVVASGYMSLRPEIMGLALHLSLVPIALSFPLVFLTRISLVPARIIATLCAFLVIYGVSILNGGLAMSELFKAVAAGITILTCALLIRKRGDFVAGVLGLGIGAAALALPGLSNDTSAGVDVMEGANKNTYSLYALPVMLLAGHICARWKTVPLVLKGVMIVCMFVELAAIFMGGNRSGYLGALVVGAMLLWDQKAKGLLLVGVMALGIALALVNLGRTEVFDRRLQQTVEGNKSDDLRVEIIKACIQITLENPLIGVSPQRIQQEIARKVEIVNYRQLDSHNVFAHIAAASGVICFAALMSFGWSLWTFAPGLGKLPKDDPLYAPRRLLRMLVILWVVRGLFTREVLYNPSFCIAIGLTVGICILAQQERNRSAGLGPRPYGDPRLLSPGATP